MRAGAERDSHEAETAGFDARLVPTEETGDPAEDAHAARPAW